MKRGSVSSARAVATAGLKRSVCPTAKATPACRAAAIIASASSSERAIGFSTSTDTPDDRNGSAMSPCSSVGTAMVTASTWPMTSRKSVSARVAVRGGDLLGAGPIDIDDRHELDTRQRRQNPRVVAPEVSDADDRDAQAHECNQTRTHENG